MIFASLSYMIIFVKINPIGIIALAQLIGNNWFSGERILRGLVMKWGHNSISPSDALWPHRSGSTLDQVIAWCLRAPSHYLNQCWLIISEVLWHTPEGNFHGRCSFLDMSLKICNLRLQPLLRASVFTSHCWFSQKILIIDTPKFNLWGWDIFCLLWVESIVNIEAWVPLWHNFLQNTPF